MILNKSFSADQLLEQYQRILEKSNIGLWTWDMATDALNCDDGIRKLYEFPEGFYVGTSEGWYQRIHDDDRQRTRDLMERVIRDEIELDSMFRIVTASGKLKYIRTTAHKIKNDSGKIVSLIGLNWDVTHEILLKSDIDQAQVFLEKVMDAIPDPIFVKNRKHQWIFANTEFEKLLGHPRTQFIGKSDYEFFPKDQADIFWKKDDEVFENNVANENEEQVIDAQGQVRVVLTKKTPYKVNEAEKFIVGVIRDITEIKKIQKSLIEQSKMATLGEMAAGIAHEVNNPLTIISGKTQLLKFKAESGSIDQEKFISDLNLIQKNCARIEKIIRSLTSFSRNSENDPFEKISVLKLIDDALEISREKLEKSSIRVLTEIDPQVTAATLIEAKFSEVTQVLINLLNNSYDAIKCLKEPWIKLRVSNLKDMIQIQVIDSGNGIPTEIAKKMMEPFFTTKPTGLGTGLGLSIALQIVKAHHGTLEYEANGPNTIFTLQFRKSIANLR